MSTIWEAKNVMQTDQWEVSPFIFPVKMRQWHQGLPFINLSDPKTICKYINIPKASGGLLTDVIDVALRVLVEKGIIKYVIIGHRRILHHEILAF